jgi:two-component system chemotaxis response regulator CheV
MSGILERVDQKTQLVGLNRLELLLFRLTDDQLYGINVFKVREVIRTPKIVRVPKSDGRLLGVAEIRDQKISIVDLSATLDIDALDVQQMKESYTVVTEFNSSIQGFVVKNVERIIHLKWEEISPPPPMFEHSSYLTGVTKADDTLVEILDVEKILADIKGLPDMLSEEYRMSIPRIDIERIRQYKVLVADDSSTARQVIEGSLERLGVASVLVANGHEAYKWLLTRALELNAEGKRIEDEILMVISDIEMPEMDGYTLTKEIRNHDLLRNLYVLIHSSLSGGFNASLIEKVGANSFVPKWHQDDLANKIVARLEAVES